MHKKKYSTEADYIYFIYYFVHNCYLFLISVFSLKPPLCKDEQISLSLIGLELRNYAYAYALTMPKTLFGCSVIVLYL